MQSLSSILSSPPTPDAVSLSPLLVMQGRDKATLPGFSPTAHLIVTPYLRTRGLLAVLPDESARTLLALLTFLTPDGRLQATATQLAVALGISDKKAEERMERLSALTWEGNPVACLLPRETGMDAIGLSPHLVSYREEIAQSASVPASAPLAGRAAIVNRSRALHARPRAEVERMVLEQLGYPASGEADTKERQVSRSLHAFGFSAQETQDFVSRFPVEEIERQVSWMGYRKAKSPKRYLMAAIEGNYAPPVEVRKNVPMGDSGNKASNRETVERVVTGVDAVP